MKTLHAERHIIGEVRRAVAESLPLLVTDHYAKAAGWAIKVCILTGETVPELCARLRITTAERDAMIRHSKKLGPQGQLPAGTRQDQLEYQVTRLTRRLAIAEAKLAVLYPDPAEDFMTPDEREAHQAADVGPGIPGIAEPTTETV